MNVLPQLLPREGLLLPVVTSPHALVAKLWGLEEALRSSPELDKAIPYTGALTPSCSPADTGLGWCRVSVQAGD